MNRDTRIKLLNKVAKKSKKTESLKGKNRVKDVSKFLEKIKKDWLAVAKEKQDAESKRDEVNAVIDNCAAMEEALKSEIKKCHEVMQCADFSGAKFVQFKGKGDDQEVMYSMDGRHFGRYNSDTHSLSYGKKKEEEAAVEDSCDASDGADKELSEGMDFNIEGFLESQKNKGL